MLGEASLGLVLVVGLTEDSLLGSAISVINGVACNTCDLRCGVGICDSALDVESLDVNESTSTSSGVGDELSNNGERQVGVDGLAWAIEVEVTHSVRVDITSISIALGSISVSNTARETRTLVKTSGAVARMTKSWSVCHSKDCSAGLTYGVYALANELASQISISLQHAPNPPVPELALLVAESHPSTLAC